MRLRRATARAVASSAALLAACRGGETAHDPGETDSTLATTAGPGETASESSTSTGAPVDASTSTGEPTGPPTGKRVAEPRWLRAIFEKHEQCTGPSGGVLTEPQDEHMREVDPARALQCGPVLFVPSVQLSFGWFGNRCTLLQRVLHLVDDAVTDLRITVREPATNTFAVQHFLIDPSVDHLVELLRGGGSRVGPLPRLAQGRTQPVVDHDRLQFVGLRPLPA